MRAGAGLRALLAWLERHGSATVPDEALARALGADLDRDPGLAALAAAGVLREGPLATTLPCGDLRPGCAREVRPTGAGGWLAVCGAEPRACEAVDVPARALRQRTVSGADLARALGALLGLEGTRAATGEPLPLPLLLGAQPRERDVRDVVLFVRPAAPQVAAWVALRERAERPALVLVPTPASLEGELAARHGPGAHVEVAALTDWLDVRGGVLVLARQLRAVPARGRTPREVLEPRESVDDAGEPAPREAPIGGRTLPVATDWREVRIRLVDGETVHVEVHGRYRRLTYLDFGLGHAITRKPTKMWQILVACCEGGGTFRWRPFGSFDAVKQVVARLRAALRTTLGIDQDPFEPFSRVAQWKTRFSAGLAE